MTIPASAAAQAYTAIAQSGSPGKTAVPASTTSQDAGFSEALKEAMTSVAEAGKTSDQTAMAQIAGKADMIDVVTAVTETELAVQTLVSVRDRMISAYQEVMRMPI